MHVPAGMLSFADGPKNNEMFLGEPKKLFLQGRFEMLMVELGSTFLYKYMEDSKNTMNEMSGSKVGAGEGISTTLFSCHEFPLLGGPTRQQFYPCT